MVYLKIQRLEGEPLENETKIREVILRRHLIIDFQSSKKDEYSGNNKGKFIGVEKKEAIDILRIRGLLFRFFPKVIVRLNLNDGVSTIKYRPSFISMLMFAACTIGILINLNTQYLLNGIGVFIIYSILFYVEYYITTLELRDYFKFTDKKDERKIRSI